MILGRDLELPSVLRFTILCRSVGMDLALAPQRRFELLESLRRMHTAPGCLKFITSAA